MTSSQFTQLSCELCSVVGFIPSHWEFVHNDELDSLLNIFPIKSYEELESKITHFPDDIQDYFRRRWYVWNCSKCDEYLFSLPDNVRPNPNLFDQRYDITINGNTEFDIKGTRIPRSFHREIEKHILNPQQLIEYYYENQSKGVRYRFQDRLFIVHHSFVDCRRELRLRCEWEYKRPLYQTYCENFSHIRTREYKGCKASVIFILEREPGRLTSVIDGL